MADIQNWITFAGEDDIAFSQPDGDSEAIINNHRAALQDATLAKADAIYLGRLCRKIGRLYRLAGSAQKAHDYLSKSHEFVAALDSAEGRVEFARLKLEAIYLHLDDHGPDQQTGQDAQEIIELLQVCPTPWTQNVWSAIGQAYNAQAIVAAENGQLDRFEKLSNEAIDAFGRAKDLGRQWQSRFNLATQLLRRGYYPAAIRQLSVCQHDLKDLDHDRQFLVYHNLANAYLAAGQLYPALKAANDSYHEAQLTNWIDQLSALQTLTDVFKEHAIASAQVGWKQSAAKYADRSVEFGLRGIGLADRVIASDDTEFVMQYQYQMHWMKAEVLIAMGQSAQAHMEIEQARLLQQTEAVILSPEMVGELDRVDALLAAMSNDWQMALVSLEKAEAAFDQYHFKGKLVLLYIERAKILMSMGQRDAARSTLLTAKQESSKLEQKRGKEEIGRLLRQLEESRSTFQIRPLLDLDETLSRLTMIAESDSERTARLDDWASKLLDNVLTEYRTGIINPSPSERTKLLEALVQIERELAPELLDFEALDVPEKGSHQPHSPETTDRHRPITVKQADTLVSQENIAVEGTQSGLPAQIIALISFLNRTQHLAILLDALQALRPEQYSQRLGHLKF